MSGPMKPLTEEEIRILAAVRDGRVVMNRAGRYVIEGEARPARRDREKLRKKGLIASVVEEGMVITYRITDSGRERLAAEGAVT